MVLLFLHKTLCLKFLIAITFDNRGIFLHLDFEEKIVCSVAEGIYSSHRIFKKKYIFMDAKVKLLVCFTMR